MRESDSSCSLVHEFVSFAIAASRAFDLLTASSVSVNAGNRGKTVLVTRLERTYACRLANLRIMTTVLMLCLYGTGRMARRRSEKNFIQAPTL